MNTTLAIRLSNLLLTASMLYITIYPIPADTPTEFAVDIQIDVCLSILSET